MRSEAMSYGPGTWLVYIYNNNYTGCLVRFYADLFGDEDDEMEITIKLIM